MLSELLLALLILLLLCPRLDIGKDGAVFVTGETNGDAIAGGGSLDGNDVTGRLVLVAPNFRWVFNAEFLFIACDGPLIAPALSTRASEREEATVEGRDTIAVEDKEVEPETE